MRRYAKARTRRPRDAICEFSLRIFFLSREVNFSTFPDLSMPEQRFITISGAPFVYAKKPFCSL